MFDIGWTEILVIVAVAVIVVGPKDIPKMLKTVGKYLRKARTMMRDVRRQVEEVADIAEIKELKETAENIKKDMGVDSFDDPMKMGEPAKPAKAETVAQVAEEKPKAKPSKAKPKTTTKAKPKTAAKAKPKTAAKAKPTAKPKAKTSTKAAAKPKPKPKTAAKKPVKKAAKSAS